VKTLDDLAGCASDDLTGWNETVNGERKHQAGLLESFGLNADEANAIVMNARRAAGWIKDDEPAEPVEQAEA
jgi:N utilization substance protein A